MKPTIHLTRGDSIELEPVCWLWRDYLPAGMLTIVGGAPGCGKTTIAMSLAAVVTRGGTWPDGSRCIEAGDVVIWSGEDPPAVLAARLHAAGANMKRVYFVDGKHEGKSFDPARDMDQLSEKLAQLEAPRLLVIDPIVSAVAGDSHESAAVRRALQPVVDLGQRLGCAVLGVTHFSKGTAGRDPIERVTGSIAFAALARLVLVAAKVQSSPREDGESRRVLVRAKSNIGPDDGGFAYALERVEVGPDVGGQRVQWLEGLDGSARELLAEAEDHDAADGAAEADKFLRDLLANGPMSANDAITDGDGAGYSKRTMQRAAKRIGVKRHKDGMQGGWVWALDGVPKVSRSPKVREGVEGATSAYSESMAPSAPSATACAHA